MSICSRVRDEWAWIHIIVEKVGIHHHPLIAQLVKNLPAMQETLVRFLGWKIHWRRNRLPTPVFLGFPCGSAGKKSACNAGDLVLIPGLGRFSWRRERLPTPVFWPGEFQGLHSPWGCKESDTTEWLSLFLVQRTDFQKKLVKYPLGICWLIYSLIQSCYSGSLLQHVSCTSCPIACNFVVPQPGIEPVSPALEGRFLTSGPPEKSSSRPLNISLTTCNCT